MVVAGVTCQNELTGGAGRDSDQFSLINCSFVMCQQRVGQDCK